MSAMLSPHPRRDFFKYCGQIGAACVTGCLATRLSAEQSTSAPPAPRPTLPDLKTAAYCGLTCNDQCPLFKATRTNDAAAKAKVFDEWGWKAKYGMEFTPDLVVCAGCKGPEAQRGPGIARCTVRKCVTGRGLDSCIRCRTLAACDKELWKNYAKFHQQMIQMQQAFAATEGFKLI
jgi:hypothetical protein